MVKKCIIKFDELENPIELIEVKEFNDGLKLKEYKALCAANKEEFLKKKAEAERKAQEEKQALKSQVESLEKNVIFLIKAVKKILGVKTNEEIEAMLKEINQDE